MYYKII